ncbi:hypothetical protein Tco_1430700 [Tanacetum coccineum]
MPVKNVLPMTSNWHGLVERKYQSVIDSAKKIVRIPFGSEILIFNGDGSRNKRGTRLNIISCTKAQNYLLQGCHVFLAHITIKETGDKSRRTTARCTDRQKFSLSISRGLARSPSHPTNKWNVTSILVPGTEHSVARAPFDLPPSEMK